MRDVGEGGRGTQQRITGGDRGGGGEGEVDTSGGHNRCGVVGERGSWTQQGVTAGVGRWGRGGGGHSRGSLQVRGVGERGRGTQQGVTAGEGRQVARGRRTLWGGWGGGEVDTTGGHCR